MSSFQYLIPQISLLIGVFGMGCLHILGDEKYVGGQWIVHTFVLILAFFQEMLLYKIPSTVFVNGGMILDGTTEILSLGILALSIIVQLNRRKEKYVLTPQINLLSLGSTLFATLAVASNRIFFGVIATLGLIWSSQAALAAESKGEEHPNIVHSGMVRGIVFLLAGLFLAILCFAVFGETQVDEIQRILARGRLENEATLFPMQILVLFLGAITMGIPPFDGLFGRSRRKSSWSLAIGMSGLFAIVGFNIFIRFGLLVFARPAIGGLEFEPMTNLNVLEAIRILSATGLILTPLLALANRHLRGSFLFILLNPFVQALFALSFGQRDVLGFVISQMFVSVLILGLIISTMTVLDLPWDYTLQKWVGIGRRNRAACLAVILALTAAAGLAPFYGSLTIQKTLSINSYYSSFLLINVAFSGFYVARMVIFAFHRGDEEAKVITVTHRQRAWILSQLALLIFMGIFWQPLYKYGAFSIRSFFGDV